MRTMRHLLLKTSKRMALIRSIRATRKPVHGKINPNTTKRSEARIIPISAAKAYMYASSFVIPRAEEDPVPEGAVPIIKLLASFPQIA